MFQFIQLTSGPLHLIILMGQDSRKGHAHGIVNMLVRLQAALHHCHHVTAVSSSK